MIARAKSVLARSMVMFKTSDLRFKIVWFHDCSYDWSHYATIDRSCDRSLHLTSDRTIGPGVPQLIVRSATGCQECSYDRSQDVTIARTIGIRMPRSIDRTICRRPSRLIVHPSLTLRLVARFPTIALSIDILQSFVIARPRVKIDRRMRPLLEIVANIADRSHLGPIATNRTIRCDCGLRQIGKNTFSF